MTFSINALTPELWCTDFEISLAFYKDVLGFDIGQRRGQDPHAYLSREGAQIMLAHWTLDGDWEPWFPEPLERPFGRGINFQFMVSDVRGLHDRVVASGVEPFLALHTATIWRTDRMDDRAQFIVLDPDGYALRFAQVVSHRPVAAADLRALDTAYGAKERR